jgi:hypothetical protein
MDRLGDLARVWRQRFGASGPAQCGAKRSASGDGAGQRAR